MSNTRSDEERAAEHDAAVEYLREGIFEQKPWLKGAVSFSGPIDDHERMARWLRGGKQGRP